VHIGAFTVEAVRESGSAGKPTYLFPDATPERLAPYRHWLEPHFLTPAGRFTMVIRTYVIRTERSVMLVDTCFGNHKERSGVDTVGHMLDTPWLEDLAALGVAPEDVDIVFCTHLHPDHVGWNTRFVDGRWVPTFPNARYFFGADDWSHFSATPETGYGYDSLHDSVIPVVEANLAVFYGREHEVDTGVVVTPSPGHTPGHSCLRLDSAGARGLVIGDLMHHPVQCAEPGWELTVGTEMLTMDPARCMQSRRECLGEAAESGALVFAAHWDQPGGCRVRADGDVWRLDS
jgi:glyoxylase-like metal-dependent hydrolase (beta-lactamase superfamily II)